MFCCRIVFVAFTPGATFQIQKGFQPDLQEWRPSKKVPKPRPGKVPKRVLWKTTTGSSKTTHEPERGVPLPNGPFSELNGPFPRVP